jgi:hypothetical protein
MLTEHLLVSYLIRLCILRARAISFLQDVRKWVGIDELKGMSMASKYLRATHLPNRSALRTSSHPVSTTSRPSRPSQQCHHHSHPSRHIPGTNPSKHRHQLRMSFPAASQDHKRAFPKPQGRQIRIHGINKKRPSKDKRHVGVGCGEVRSRHVRGYANRVWGLQKNGALPR